MEVEIFVLVKPEGRIVIGPLGADWTLKGTSGCYSDNPVVTNASSSAYTGAGRCIHRQLCVVSRDKRRELSHTQERQKRPGHGGQ
jgi:hypothetical protein